VYVHLQLESLKSDMNLMESSKVDQTQRLNLQQQIADSQQQIADIQRLLDKVTLDYTRLQQGIDNNTLEYKHVNQEIAHYNAHHCETYPDC